MTSSFGGNLPNTKVDIMTKEKEKRERASKKAPAKNLKEKRAAKQAKRLDKNVVVEALR